jgi:hypothetical protein
MGGKPRYRRRAARRLELAKTFRKFKLKQSIKALEYTTGNK